MDEAIEAEAKIAPSELRLVRQDTSHERRPGKRCEGTRVSEKAYSMRLRGE